MSPSQMNPYLKDLEAVLSKIFEKLKTDLAAIRSNRPSVALVEEVKVNYFDQWLTVKQLGSLAIAPPRDILITVWDKQAVAAVMQAIENAHIGISLSSEGNVIRASLPALTEERRAEFTKLAKKIVEEARIKIRHSRDETIRHIKTAERNQEMNEDDAFKEKEQAQKIVDKANSKVKELLEEKLRELAE